MTRTEIRELAKLAVARKGDACTYKWICSKGKFRIKVQFWGLTEKRYAESDSTAYPNPFNVAKQEAFDAIVDRVTDIIEQVLGGEVEKGTSNANESRD